MTTLGVDIYGISYILESKYITILDILNQSIFHLHRVRYHLLSDLRVYSVIFCHIHNVNRRAPPGEAILPSDGGTLRSPRPNPQGRNPAVINTHSSTLQQLNIGL